MREIKFRAYDKFFKRMDNVQVVDFFERRAILGNGERRDIDLDLELMQFTGLKDKNGKEIYEGDIIGGGVSNFEVKYDEHYGAYMCEFNFLKHMINIGFKVIGNIYENPELLKT